MVTGVKADLGLQGLCPSEAIKCLLNGPNFMSCKLIFPSPSSPWGFALCSCLPQILQLSESLFLKRIAVSLKFTGILTNSRAFKLGEELGLQSGEVPAGQNRMMKSKGNSFVWLFFFFFHRGQASKAESMMFSITALTMTWFVSLPKSKMASQSVKGSLL